MKKSISIIGGGLAGSECAYQLALRGFMVYLYEMRPSKQTEAHKTPYLAELVCSNSLKSTSLSTSSGLLKEELKLLNSIIIKTSYETAVPAGNSLSVDRLKFSKKITNILKSLKNIKIIEKEVESIDDIEGDYIVIATGPLTSNKLADDISLKFGDNLYFYDAISPIVESETIDFDKCFFASRYNKGNPDFLNYPIKEEEFEIFYNELINAKTTTYKSFENPRYFEGCLPIEEMAKRGKETLLFGPFRPVGLKYQNKTPFAVLQLRRENEEGTAYNLVGCQTKMLYSEQKRVFKIFEALKNATFLRFGSMHRNTYINSPQILSKNFMVKNNKKIYFAGQISGVEGYVESIASGLIVALDIIFREASKTLELPNPTALHALSNYNINFQGKSFSPSNFHFGLLPPLEIKVKNKKERKLLYSKRALEELSDFIEKYRFMLKFTYELK
ncbi:MAG: methylenetetrahydrofolate--tRNA-(uracil(54)-C(5))-methyltransferase (FADH(2)-oxidizing) TrmFO [Deferribacterota bacterium]|nr:methylenetetrahydrofolate--tRNA-(uracil(54)-C(5))-methyltransferase (FADH(2)-oxidizing) TrmFO [Deferribacterota bacterium]